MAISLPRQRFKRPVKAPYPGWTFQTKKKKLCVYSKLSVFIHDATFDDREVEDAVRSAAGNRTVMYLPPALSATPPGSAIIHTSSEPIKPPPIVTAPTIGITATTVDDSRTGSVGSDGGIEQDLPSPLLVHQIEGEDKGEGGSGSRSTSPVASSSFLFTRSLGRKWWRRGTARGEAAAGAWKAGAFGITETIKAAEVILGEYVQTRYCACV